MRSFDAMLELRHLRQLSLTYICGLLIETKSQEINKPVLKPHVIVCLTSALMMIISKIADFDSTRRNAQIVSGISFIGGGIFMRDKKISGLTALQRYLGDLSIGMAIVEDMVLWRRNIACSLC